MRGELSNKGPQNLPTNNSYALTHQCLGIPPSKFIIAEIKNVLNLIYGTTTIYTNYISQQLHFEQLGKTINIFTLNDITDIKYENPRQMLRNSR
jgi:hypothetical protein